MSFDPRGYALAEGDGEPWWFLDCLMTLKATGEQTQDAFTMLEWHAPVGSVPLGVHRREDEAFYLLDGEMRVECDGRTWELGPGGFVFLPRGLEHAFVVTSGPVRGLQVTAPAQFERYVRGVGRTPDREGLPLPSAPDVQALVSVAEELAIDIVGPPMDLAAAT